MFMSVGGALVLKMAAVLLGLFVCGLKRLGFLSNRSDRTDSLMVCLHPLKFINAFNFH